LKLLPEGATLNQVTAAILFGLIKSWDNSFANPVADIVDDNIIDIYYFYRADKNIFSNAPENNKTKQEYFVVPDAVFELLDYRAIEFLQTLDRVYLGKFITDPDTEARILKWIKERFESGNVPVGQDNPLIDEFVQEFGDVVRLESWKIRRIIETTTNSARNTANVNYMSQALIAEYQVVEVMDDKTCGWCRHMNGKTFSVRIAVEQQERLYRDGINMLPKYSPFATSMKLDEFVKLDPKSIQNKGVRIPAHPLCRGRYIAHFKR
jgi:SPP1 gp7 family putative phage head morphogenesis protein